MQLIENFSHDYDLHLAVGEMGYLFEGARRRGVKVYQVPSLIRAIRPWHDLRAFRDLTKLICRVQPDLVHCHSFKAGVLGRLAARRVGTPCIFTAHGWSFAEGAPTLQRRAGLFVEKSLGPRTTRIITVSEADRELALRHDVAPSETLVRIHNALPDLETPKRRPHVPPRIVCVARIAHQKHHACLLKAAALIDIDFRLLLVGSGPLLNQTLKTIGTLGLKSKVELILDSENVVEYLDESDIFALTSRWEGLPVSILEAMRSGLPVVATRVGGVPEMVVSGKNGLLVESNDHYGLARALKLLLQDADLRLRFGAAGKRRFQSEFLERDMIQKTAAIYGQVLRPNG